MSLLRCSFSALLPRSNQLLRRWMGRAPLFWRRLPPPPGFMPRAEPVTVEDIGMSYLVRAPRRFTPHRAHTRTQPGNGRSRWRSYQR